MTRLSAAQLDELYTRLCYGLTGRGTEQTPTVLARLVLLLMHELDDPVAIDRAIGEALDLPTAG